MADVLAAPYVQQNVFSPFTQSKRVIQFMKNEQTGVG